MARRQDTGKRKCAGEEDRWPQQARTIDALKEFSAKKHGKPGGQATGGGNILPRKRYESYARKRTKRLPVGHREAAADRKGLPSAASIMKERGGISQAMHELAKQCNPGSGFLGE